MSENTGLLDLPNELLLVISEDLNDDSLLHLAATCQRVNLLLLPTIFTRFGLELPPPSGVLQSLTIARQNLKLLSVLGITPWITSIEVLDCIFTFTPKKTHGSDLRPLFSSALLAIRSLNSLATRLSHLCHLRFKPYVPLNSTDELSEWLQSVAVFLNSVIQRGDCSITVDCAPEPDYSADPRPFLHFVPEVPRTRATASLPSRTIPSNFSVLSVLQMLVSFFRPIRTLDPQPIDIPDVLESVVPFSMTPDAVESAAPDTQSFERPPITILPTASHPALKVLSIHGSLLFHATFYRWTLHMLNTAPLTTLSLDFIDLSHYDWALTLPALTLSVLTSLKIGQECAIAVPDLTRFLARHTGIRTLDLSFHVAIGSLSPPLAQAILPRLESLCGTPDYLLYFLAGVGGSGYPDLRRVGMTSNDDSAYQQTQFTRLLICVEARQVIPVVELGGKLANCSEVPAHLQ
ncbi:F-box domain-containing protein [Mycena venus]|uniref:F-box domain-containing protein n=1 Tax=Mycena venus TaxID=2733690 RepID=A0A8H6XNA8_9AGAR|nr:F-box domain-containing protein [Mycena venus]